MRRREFLNGTLAAAAGLASTARRSFGVLNPRGADGVKQVLIVFMCHLDVGFTDTQAAVVSKYFNQYFPAAMQVASVMRGSGEDRYIWTTGSWLLYEYLDALRGSDLAGAERAVDAGDLAWHALPFNWQTEMLDRSMIEGAMGLSQSLDRRFGRVTRGGKMSDVPGHSRGLIAPLAANGVMLLDIGVNGASTVPDVPATFVWQEPAGASIIMMYHSGYGGIIQVPNSDLAVDLEIRNDNSGPHSLEEIRAIYAKLRKRFPNAVVRAANMTDVAAAAEPFSRALPVVTEEIGDTWIYGVPSDPIKVARYRETMRLRKEWLAQGKFRVGDSTDLKFLRKLLLAPEHTWGVDTKRLHDYQHYTPAALKTVLDAPQFRWAEGSWAEKRKDIDEAVSSLPQALGAEAVSRLRALTPAVPEKSGLKSQHPGGAIDTTHFVIALDPVTGAITRLRHKATGREWCSADHPLALFAYQTLSAEDYERYRAAYIIVKTWWSPMDFGKPDIEKFGAQNRLWLPSVKSCWAGRAADGWRIVSQLEITDAEAQRSGVVAWPRTAYLEISLPETEAALYLTLSCFDKPANRLPEAMWLSFLPIAPARDGWTLDKVDQAVSPFDVVAGGNRHMHAVTNGVRYKDAQGSLSIEALDAPVVALGERSPIFYSNDQPDLSKGIHFSLFNNAWGTNYIQWFGENTRFRFILRF